MGDPEIRNFGQFIRERRRRLNLTQEEVAGRLRISASHISHLEVGIRHPSRQIVAKLSDALRLNPRDLFLLANPRVDSCISETQKSDGTSTWYAFAEDMSVREIHNITDEEMKTLSLVAKMGEVQDPRDFVFILNAVRQALGR